MANGRLDQIQKHLLHDPSRIDGQVFLITGAGQGALPSTCISPQTCR